jgi:hypothetical protein
VCCVPVRARCLVVPCEKYHRLIKAYARVTGKTHGDSLFTDCMVLGAPLSKSGFGQRIARLFNPLTGKEVTITSIRKSFTSSNHKEAYAKMEADAQVFGHSVERQRTSYVKFDAPE